VQLSSSVSIPWTQIDSIIWTPGEILSCVNCPSPVATATYSTTITATAWSNGCAEPASIQLRVDAEHDVYIPNVFSPNADGINDQFTIYGKKSLKQILRLEVYDRWGNNVFIKENFDPNDPREGWNGTFRGEPLNPGVYVFRAEVEFTDGFIDNYGGDVTLLR
jgi:gliding motility-associated-like protein